jgi:LmbE family N-acetylglucosaminyl deacetylase
VSIAILPPAKRPVWRRALAVAASVPLICLALFCSLRAYQIYAHNRAADHDQFPATVPLASGESVLIISPHPDDETLGTAGLIQNALKLGVPVHVVFVTDGDAFRVGVASYFHELRVRPSDYVQYGIMREGEARAALATLGLQSSDITFLGYPDQGTLPIWRGHWLPSDSYTSPYTHASSVPYPDALHRGSPYCGASIVSDLTEVIARYQPTDIYTTHPSDDHPDHSAAPAFLNVALSNLVTAGDDWAADVRVHYFLVHRGDWPVPQGLDEDAPLAPPAPMLYLDTHWHTLNLTGQQVQRKKDALTHYASQRQLMQRFLSSFIRTNELFGQLPDNNSPIMEVGDGAIVIDGNGSDWPSEAKFDTDPVADSVVRDFQSGADLRDVYVCADNNNLYVRVDTQQALSSEIHYNLYLRAFDADGATHDSGLFVVFSPRDVSPGQETELDHGIRVAYSDNTLEAAIPLSNFGRRRPSEIYLETASLFSHVIVDRTGIRCGRLAPASIPAKPASKPMS